MDYSTCFVKRANGHAAILQQTELDVGLDLVLSLPMRRHGRGRRGRVHHRAHRRDALLAVQSGAIAAAAVAVRAKCVPNPTGYELRAPPHHTMTRDSRHSTLWKGLTCLFALQLPLVGAQLAEIEKATNASLLWGPYRPNLYFGVRPRIPKSLMGGLMWARVDDYQSIQHSEYDQ